MAIHDKLVNIQKELKAPKGQYNSFGKYKYRSCEDILEAVKPLLAKNGCILTLSDDIVSAGNRFYIKAVATISDGDSSITVSALAREEETKKGMDGSQITGTASSYARKYALNGLFCIDDTKDADTDAYTSRTAVNTPKTASQPKNDKVYICQVCGANIVDAGGATAVAIASATKKKYGKCMCKNCIDNQIVENQNNIDTLANSEIPFEIK